MKKTIYLICFSLLGLSAISCQKEKTTTEPSSSREPIMFSARAPRTKGEAPLNSLYDLRDQGFSVSAWYSPNEAEFGDGSEKAYIVNHRFGTLDATISESTVWQGIYKAGETEYKADPVYYPLDGSLSFFCFAPYRELSESSDIRLISNPEEAITSQLAEFNYLSNSPLICYTPALNTINQFDFVASEPVQNWKKGDGVIPLDFTKHLTTRLRFYCDYDGQLNDEEKVIVTNIQLANVIGSEYLFFIKDADGNLGHQWCDRISPEDGSQSMPLVTYELSTNREELVNNAYLMKHSNDDAFRWVNYTQNGRMYVLPQAFPEKEDENDIVDDEEDPILIITYQIQNNEGLMLDENVVQFDLRGSPAWEMGKTMAYYLTIGVKERKDLNVISVNIEDWIDSHNQHEPEEILY